MVHEQGPAGTAAQPHQPRGLHAILADLLLYRQPGALVVDGLICLAACYALHGLVWYLQDDRMHASAQPTTLMGVVVANGAQWFWYLAMTLAAVGIVRIFGAAITSRRDPGTP